jgi:hypothetical protein
MNNIFSGSIKGILYILAKECRFEKKILIIIGLLLFTGLAVLLFYKTPSEFRLFAFGFIVIPMLYLTFFADFWDDVELDRQFSDKKFKQELNYELTINPDVANSQIDRIIDEYKSLIFEEIRIQEKMNKKMKKKRRKVLEQNKKIVDDEYLKGLKKYIKEESKC